MEIEYKGANCVVIKTKQSTFVVDPFLAKLGLKDQIAKATTCLLTSDQQAANNTVLTFSGAGEYEVGSVSIRGVAARAHTATTDEGRHATMYVIDSGENRVAVIGHVATPLDEEQLEALGLVDIAIIPVGGNGFTLDAHEAINLVGQLDPKIVIPTHYADKEIAYEVAQQDLESFLKELSAPVETMPKLKLKGATPSEALQIVVLERTS